MLRSICFSIACLSLCVAVARAQSNVSVFATGLDNPRGLTFGPDGDVYVAEGGTGGKLSTTVPIARRYRSPLVLTRADSHHASRKSLPLARARPSSIICRRAKRARRSATSRAVSLTSRS